MQLKSFRRQCSHCSFALDVKVTEKGMLGRGLWGGRGGGGMPGKGNMGK